jgi:3-hydroxybutyrate dehydrogenase
MQALLAGRHAVVSGGSRGIGRAIAAALTGAGASVSILGRDRQALEAAMSGKAAARSFTADVTDEAQCRAALAAAEREAGPVDIMIANAGNAESAPFAKSDDQLFRRMLDLNLMGAVHVVRPVIGGMAERGFGRVVVVASLAGLRGYAYVSAYVAAKHAAVGLARALAAEFDGTGVTVNAVCPGYTDTDLVRNSIDRIVQKTGRTREVALAAMLAPDAQEELIAPEDVAAAVLRLCAPEASGVNGEAIAVEKKN